MQVGGAGWPRVHGHSYASLDPKASADFAIKYLGATLVSDHTPSCEHAGGTPPPREVSVRLPHHADYRGGGLLLRFVYNARKPGGAYDIAAHVAAMGILFGNLSSNTGHHWNQFFDSHLGFYAKPSSQIATELLRDEVPFFTGQSSGVRPHASTPHGWEKPLPWRWLLDGLLAVCRLMSRSSRHALRRSSNRSM
jgi:hypothetical protein